MLINWLKRGRKGGESVGKRKGRMEEEVLYSSRALLSRGGEKGKSFGEEKKGGKRKKEEIQKKNNPNAPQPPRFLHRGRGGEEQPYSRGRNNFSFNTLPTV